MTLCFVGSGRPDGQGGAERSHVLANCLLAPGSFLDQSHKAGADVDAEPLAVPEGEVPAELVDLVVSRYHSVA